MRKATQSEGKHHNIQVIKKDTVCLPALNRIENLAFLNLYQDYARHCTDNFDTLITNHATTRNASSNHMAEQAVFKRYSTTDTTKQPVILILNNNV